MRLFRVGLQFAVALAALASAGVDGVPPAAAGNLNACDEARVAVRAAIADAYRPVLAKLDGWTSEGSAPGLGPAKAASFGGSDADKPVDVGASRADLEQQEATDLGLAERRVAGECRAGIDSMAEITKWAADLAVHSIAAVLANHGMAVATAGASH
jgi:hypothetical protein